MSVRAAGEETKSNRKRIKMRPILICCLIVIVVLSFTDLSEGKRRKKFGIYNKANNEKYIGNPGNKYPHIHRDKDFIVYSKGRHDHVELHKDPSKAIEVLRNEDYSNAENPKAITDILIKIWNDYTK